MMKSRMLQIAIGIVPILTIAILGLVFAVIAYNLVVKSTLQTSYANSDIPQIVTTEEEGAVTFRNGTSLDTDIVIETQNTVGTTNFSVSGNGNIQTNGNISCNSISGSDMVTTTNLQLGADSLNAGKCVTIRMVSGSVWTISGLLMAIVDDGNGVARVVPTDHTILHADEQPSVGVSSSVSVAPGSDVTICVGGMFEVSVEDDAEINIGEYLVRSKVNDGRAYSLPDSEQGAFAVALTHVTGVPDGSVKVMGMFIKNEAY